MSQSKYLYNENTKSSAAAALAVQWQLAKWMEKLAEFYLNKWVNIENAFSSVNYRLNKIMADRNCFHDWMQIKAKCLFK